MAKTKFCEGVSDISDSYMGFIIDPWGVLHNSEGAFDGVIDCLKELKIRKKQVIILSNSDERAEANKIALKKIGIGPSLYSHIVTPGEVIWNGVKNRSEDVFEGLGENCYVITRGGDLSMVEGTGINVVDDIEKADFLLIAGTDFPEKMPADYEPVIRRAIQKRLKAFCANPDSFALINASYLMGRGMLARRYSDSGGIVNYIGKPHSTIFKVCIKLLQKKDVYPAQTVMLGDSMANDIIGASMVGIDTCLFKSGIHSANFSHCENLKQVNNALRNLMAQYNNVMPNYLMDEMKWGRALPDRKHKKRKQPVS